MNEILGSNYLLPIHAALAKIKKRLISGSIIDYEYEITYYPFLDKYIISQNNVNNSKNLPANEYYSMWHQYENVLMDHMQYGKVIFSCSAEYDPKDYVFCKYCKANVYKCGCKPFMPLPQDINDEIMDNEISKCLDDVEKIEAKRDTVNAEMRHFLSNITAKKMDKVKWP